MDQTNDGGPAFPCTDAKGFVSEGMSLRDYFAGQALAGMLTCSYINSSKVDLSREAYRFADRMLAERQKERE